MEGTMARERVLARLDLKILVTCLALMCGCAPSCGINWDCNDCYDPPPGSKAKNLIARAKDDLAARKYSEAQQKCEKAEKLDPSNPEAPYCVLLANVGALVQSLSSILSLGVSQLRAPNYKPSAIDVKAILGAVLSDLEGQIAYIDLYSYKLSKFDNPTFQLDDFSLRVDAGDISTLLGPDSGVKVNGPIEINLKGTWDISEVAALGAAVNAAQGMLDYLMAHHLIIDSTEFGSGTAGLAKFLADNQKLLTKDAADTGRITGDETHKGIKDDFLAALSYAVGRKDDRVWVAPANGGLVAAIRQSVMNNAVDAVVQYKDTDMDGIPERFTIPALSDLRMAVTGIDIQTEFDNPLSKATSRAILKAGAALRNNIETGGAPVPLTSVLRGVANDLKEPFPNFRIFAKTIPDLIAVNPAAFFAKPKYLRSLLPVYFTYTSNLTSEVHYDMAWEKEMYGVDGNVRERLGVVDAALPTAGDFSHFSFGVPDAVTSAVTVDGYTFEEGIVPNDLFLEADGIIAGVKWPVLQAVALPDPSFGGLLELNTAWLANPSAGTSSFEAADNGSFNKSLNSLIRAYCLNLAELGDGASLGDYFDEQSVRYAENRIADCP
jgi:hypothetical protein